MNPNSLAFGHGMVNAERLQFLYSLNGTGGRFAINGFCAIFDKDVT
jgi:hypothetical protein